MDWLPVAFFGVMAVSLVITALAVWVVFRDRSPRDRRSHAKRIGGSSIRQSPPAAEVTAPVTAAAARRICVAFCRAISFKFIRSIPGGGNLVHRKIA